ncbi:MAG: hypothetical protein AAF957_25290 [Planctomycetota bacterium]
MPVRVTRRKGTGATLEVDLDNGNGGDEWSAIVKVEWVESHADAAAPQPQEGVVNNEVGFAIWRNVEPAADNTASLQLKFRMRPGLTSLRLAVTIFDVPQSNGFTLPFVVTP